MIRPITILLVLLWWNGLLAVSAIASRITFSVMVTELTRQGWEPEKWMALSRKEKWEAEKSVVRKLSISNRFGYCGLKMLSLPWKLICVIAERSMIVEVEIEDENSKKETRGA